MHRDSLRIVELPIPRPLPTELPEKPPRGVELLDPIVTRVHHINRMPDVPDQSVKTNAGEVNCPFPAPAEPNEKPKPKSAFADGTPNIRHASRASPAAPGKHKPPHLKLRFTTRFPRRILSAPPRPLLRSTRSSRARPFPLSEAFEDCACPDDQENRSKDKPAVCPAWYEPLDDEPPWWPSRP